jgi:hypothetical protein
MAVSKYWMVYVGVFVPVFISIISVVLVLTLKPAVSSPAKPRKCDADSDCQHSGTCEDGKCECTPQWTGDRCQVVAVPPTALQAGSAQCGATPVSCSDDTSCVVCGSQGLFKCTHVQPSDTPFNVSGKFCLPTKPEDGCEHDPGEGQYSEYTRGKYMWQGWQDVETQKWTCTCPYPDYYAPAIGGEHAGACEKTPQLCAYGTWHFPCKGQVCDLNDADTAKLLDSSPLYNGYCQCENVPCTGGEQCASGKCVDGVCQGQRLGLNATTGLPECVADSCAPYGKWVDTGKPPYTYGRCVCQKGAVDNGYTCTPVQPDAPACPNNCSAHGACVASSGGGMNGQCMCVPGYSGAACDTFTCTPNLCDARGGCVGPNTCKCALGQVYDKTTQLCATPASCNPPPTVDPITGDIANRYNYRDASGLYCVGGSPAQVDALCLAAGFDRADSSSKCMKFTDCNAVPCDEPFCGPGVTSAVGAIGKVRAEDGVTCLNPSPADVQELCALSGYGHSNLFLIDGQYQCVAFETMNNIVLTSLRAVEGVGVEGVMCVSFAAQTDFQKRLLLDGNDLFATYQVFLRHDIDELSVEGQGETLLPTPLVNKLLRLRRMDATPSSPCQGYYYEFSDHFLSTDAAMVATTAGTPLYIQVQAYPVTRWTCQTADTPTPQCTPEYSSQYYDLELEPYKPEPGISAALDPILLPEAAYQLATSADWHTTAFKPQDSVNPEVAQVVDVDKLSKAPLFVAPPGASSPVVQVACTASYCVTGSGITKKLIILAWADVTDMNVEDLGLACASVLAPVKVKYNLVRTAPQGGVVSLLGPQQHVSTAMVKKQKVAYYIDVLPADVHREWEYTLTAYVAPTEDTTYERSPCKSREQTFTVVVEPYNEKFCNAIPSPERNQLPPYTWLDGTTGMCKWSESEVAAIDYYCAIVKAGKGTDFPYTQLMMADRDMNCSELLPSYPTVNNNWQSATCDPEYELPATKYECVRVPPSVKPLLINVQLEKLQTPGVSVFNALNELVVTAGSAGQPLIVTSDAIQAHWSAPPSFFLCQFFLQSVQSPSSAVTISATLSRRVPNPNEPIVTVATGSMQVSAGQQLNIIKQLVVKVPDSVSELNVLAGDYTMVIAVRADNQAPVTAVIQQAGYTDTYPLPSPNTSAMTCAQTTTGKYNTRRECEQACTNASTVMVQGLGAGAIMASTCLPPQPPTSASLDRRVCAGLPQTRQVTCIPELKFAGEGTLGDKVEFQNRMNGLRQWYVDHHLGGHYDAVTNSGYFMGDVATEVKRGEGEDDAAFALRLWTLISGEQDPSAGGVQQALPLVSGKQSMTCQDYKPLCDLALSHSYLHDHATAFGCGLPCNTPGPVMVYNQYYHCGPASQPDRYGYVAGSCEGGDTRCTDLLAPILDGNQSTTCQSNNLCAPWQPQPASDRIYTQTRTCFPSQQYQKPASECCACRGTYDVDRGVTPYVPSCTCDDPAGPPCNFPVGAK